MQGPHFDTHMEDDVCVVAPSGELDMACVDRFRAVFAPLHGRVIVDLSGVTFLDSSTLGVLVAESKRLRAVGGDLGIRSPRDAQRQVLEITGLGDWIVD